MKRILIADCKQEISSFNPLPSHYDNFLIRNGEELYEQRGQNRGARRRARGVRGTARH